MKISSSSRYVRQVVKHGKTGDDMSAFKAWIDEHGRRNQSFIIPYPTSSNSLYMPTRHGKGIILTPEARLFFSNVKLLLACATRETLHGRLRVYVTTHEPDCRRRDINNITKALFDALEAASVYLDDAQIDETLIRRGDLSEGEPWVEVHIVEIDTRTQAEFDEARRAKKLDALGRKAAQGVDDLIQQAIKCTGG